MKLRNFLKALLIILEIIGIFACNRANTNTISVPQHPCNLAQVLCVVAGNKLNVNILDKTTGQNLVIGNNAKIKFTSIGIQYSDRGKLDSTGFNIDSVNHYLTTYIPSYSIYSGTGNDTVFISVPGYTKDQILIKSVFVSDGCCGTMVPTGIFLNGSAQCSNCNGFTLNILK